MSAKNVFTHTLKDTVELEFKNPKGEIRKEYVTELNMREPIGGDFLSIDHATGEMGKMHAFAAALCDVDIRVINRLHRDDWAVIIEKAAGFFPDALKT